MTHVPGLLLGSLLVWWQCCHHTLAADYNQLSFDELYTMLYTNSAQGVQLYPDQLTRSPDFSNAAASTSKSTTAAPGQAMTLPPPSFQADVGPTMYSSDDFSTSDILDDFEQYIDYAESSSDIGQKAFFDGANFVNPLSPELVSNIPEGSTHPTPMLQPGSEQPSSAQLTRHSALEPESLPESTGDSPESLTASRAQDSITYALHADIDWALREYLKTRPSTSAAIPIEELTQYLNGRKLIVNQLPRRYFNEQLKLIPSQLPPQLAAYWLDIRIMKSLNHHISTIRGKYQAWQSQYVTDQAPDWDQDLQTSFKVNTYVVSRRLQENLFVYIVYWDKQAKKFKSLVPTPGQALSAKNSIDIQKHMCDSWSFCMIHILGITKYHSLAEHFLLNRLANSKGTKMMTFIMSQITSGDPPKPLPKDLR